MISRTPTTLDFRHAGVLLGSYQLADPFKPFLHPLCTPSGRCVTQASPHDHKHHKGLMFAFACHDVNFWEESPEDGKAVGRQRQTSLSLLSTPHPGFTQHLRWEAQDGSLPTFDEVRTVSCNATKDMVEWTWHSRLTPLRDVTLTQSKWSWPTPNDGPKVNYHGLGLRLLRDFIQGHTLKTAPPHTQHASILDAMGLTPAETTFEAPFDPPYPAWPPPRVRLTVRQPATQAFPLFALAAHFPYLALGPSNLHPHPLQQGHPLDARFSLSIEDPPTPT